MDSSYSGNTWSTLLIVKYTRFILFNRRSKQKVQERQLPAKVIVTEVDMGRSFSVLLFCIAMDPVLHYLNKIPGVIAVQGYVDDTILVGDDIDQFQWLEVVGNLCKNLESAGIMVEPYRCWRAEWVNAPSCTSSKIDDGHPLEWILNTLGASTLKQFSEQDLQAFHMDVLQFAEKEHIVLSAGLRSPIS